MKPIFRNEHLENNSLRFTYKRLNRIVSPTLPILEMYFIYMENYVSFFNDSPVISYYFKSFDISLFSADSFVLYHLDQADYSLKRESQRFKI